MNTGKLIFILLLSCFLMRRCTRPESFTPKPIIQTIGLEINFIYLPVNTTIRIPLLMVPLLIIYKDIGYIYCNYE